MKESKTPSPKKKIRPRHRQIIFALLIYSVIGFFILPAIIKWQLVKRLPGLTHRQAIVQKVRLNPFVLSLTIRGLSLTETNGEPFAGFDEFYGNFQLSSLFRRAWTFREIKLIHPTGSVVRDANGQFNFANLFTNAPTAATNQSKSLPSLIVQHLVVTNGNVKITDLTRAKPFHTEYGPIDVDLKDFTTRRDSNEPYSFVATTGEGERFAWSGKFSVNPPRSAGEFKLLGIPLKKYSPFLAEFARIEITDGVLGVGANYRLDADAIPMELEVTNAAVTLSNLQVNAPDSGEKLLALKNFSVTNASASLAAREIHVPVVVVNGGSLLARCESDGQLNWLALVVSKTNASANVATNTNTQMIASVPWKMTLAEFKVEHFAVTAEDRTTLTPAQIGLDELHLDLKGISNQSNAPVTANINFNWRGGGTANVIANGTLIPPAGEANLAITNLALPPIQPYVEQQARLVVNTGDLTVNGHARFTPTGATLVQFTGDVSIAKFATVDTVAHHDFVKWDDLNLRGIQVSLQTNSLNVNEVKFTKLETSLVVNSNGQLNVQALLREKLGTNTTSQSTNAVTQAAATNLNSFPIKIGTLIFEKGSLHAADQSLTPHFNTTIEEFEGSIRDLTWPGLTKATVDIHGKASAQAPFSLTGFITPDQKNPFVDLKITFTNNDLTAYDPYSAKFVGRSLSKGKLTFNLHYNIENRKLKGENSISLEQLTFGARNQSTNATQLPVKLAVSLLKDRNGRIDLNLPVSGNLDDPQFSIAALVSKAIMNILAKVATSPFSLLGAIFGGNGNGEELQFVDFTPGSATLNPTQTSKLNKLTKALYERPELSLEISATVDFATDSNALAREKLRGKIKSLRLQELTAQGKAVTEELKLEDNDYDRLLHKMYKEAFNTTPERALREAQAAATNATGGSGLFPTKEVKKGSSGLINNSSDSTTKATPPNSSMVKSKAQEEFIREELEQRLSLASPASEDDLRVLMQRRTEAVQKFMLATGKVTTDRILLAAPKPVDPSIKGAARAIFSLE